MPTAQAGTAGKGASSAAADPVHGCGPYSTSRWLAERLPLLDGLQLVLLPGRPDKFPAVGDKWEQHPGLAIPELQAQAPANVCWHIGADGSIHIAIDIDGARVIAFCQAHGCDPLTADTWRIIRTSTSDRLKVVFTVTPEQRAILTAADSGKAVWVGKGENGPDDRGEELALFGKPGTQIVVLGDHYTKESNFTDHDDQYAWAGRLPAEAAPLPAEWFELLEGVFCGDRPLRPATLRTVQPASSRKRGAYRSSGEWSNSKGNPCPICGRQHSGGCSIHSDGRSVWCKHGETCSAPDCSKSGETITGRDGQTWAYVRTEEQDPFGERSLFVIDDPTRKRKPPSRELIRHSRNGHGGNGHHQTPVAQGEPVADPVAQPVASGQDATHQGLAAVLEAVGEGWRVDEKGGGGMKPTRLPPGELMNRLLRKLGPRLEFDQMALLPTIDRVHPDAADLELLYVKFSDRGWAISKEHAMDGITAAARERQFHPVRDYLNRIVADPAIAPIDLATFGETYFNVTDPLQQRFLQLMLLGAVWRIQEPGCDFKTMVVLYGAQTLFKSLSLRALAGGDWFSDTHQDSDKDSRLAIHRSWILELAELEAVTARKDVSALKALLSPTSDTFRPPYGRSMVTMKRSSIFVGSTNKTEFLVDDTGNDRFLVVHITQELDHERIAADRDRIWKAAMLAYRDGHRPFLSRAERAASEAQNEQHITQHPWLPMLERWTSSHHCPAEFSTDEALVGAGCRAENQVTKGNAKEAAPLLKQLGFEQTANARAHRGQRVRLWRRGTGDTGDTGDTGASTPPVSLLCQPNPSPTQPSDPLTQMTQEIPIEGSIEGGTAAGVPPAGAPAGGDSPYVGVLPVSPVSGAQTPCAATDLPDTGADTCGTGGTSPVSPIPHGPTAPWLAPLLDLIHTEPGLTPNAYGDRLYMEQRLDVPSRFIAAVLEGDLTAAVLGDEAAA